MTHNFFEGGGIYTNSAKMGSECTICIRFSKIFSGTPRPPLLREDKNPPPPLAFPLGEKIDTNSAKNGLRMHHLHPFFKKNSRGRPPGPPPDRGVPPPAPSPCGASRRFGYAPPGSGASGSATGQNF